MNPRRLTPSMSLLVAFEAAARHQSFTRAAEELSLTQSAVSRQVQALEALLEVSLFRREGRQVVLTAIGATYQHELSSALGRIRSATLQAIAFQSGSGTLHLAVLPTFGSKWLLPRLDRFYAEHPGMLIHIHTRIGETDFASSDLDAVICVGEGPFPDQVAHCLLPEELLVVASPQLVPRASTLSPEDISGQLLLNVATRPEAWGQWFEQQGLPHRTMRIGPSFELTSHLIQAVVAGIGIGLVPRVLAESELSNGSLISLFAPMPSPRGYYLVYPKRNELLPSLAAFREWLLSQSVQ